MTGVGRFYLTAGATVLACFGWPGFASMTHGQLTTPQLVLDIGCHVVGGAGLGLAHTLAKGTP
mgnify:FL=1